MNGRPWTTYDREFVRLTYGHLAVPRIAKHLGRSVQAIYAMARDQALQISRGAKRPWTPYEREFVRLTYTEIPTDVVAKHLKRSVLSVYQEAYGQGLRKSERFYARPDCGRTDGKRGEANRFQKGIVPWNKGTHYVAGGRSAETRFKPGQKPQTWVPVGTVVADPDGYLKEKVRDDAPPGQSRFNWRFVHVMTWEEHHGPVPEGHNVVFRNGDKRDCRRIENLELISNAELARRNCAKRWARPRWVNEAIAAKARLTREINKREKRRNERDQEQV